jgi:2-polyprenyl-6-methoxyphenol hydroxylase-like FAD-dependent oxidoreductase
MNAMGQGSGHLEADVTIVGAGLAGTILAGVLGRRGCKVALVDPHAIFPKVFKAEKIDQEQVRVLRKLDLLAAVLPFAGSVRSVQVGYDGRIVKTVPIEQYGLACDAMVNALRARLPPNVEFLCHSVKRLELGNDVQRVEMAAGSELSSRLVLLATGKALAFAGGLELQRKILQRNQCVVLGFDVEPRDGGTFDYDSVTYYALESPPNIGYLTLFRFPHGMRANLFAYCAITEPWLREFLANPEERLRVCLPGHERVTGAFKVTSAIQTGTVDLYQTDTPCRDGMVLVGDAFQTACPATGLGLSKILADTEVLAECIPRWLSSPGMGADKLGEFYRDPRKVQSDARALALSIRNRNIVTGTSLRWKTHRILAHLNWRVRSLHYVFPSKLPKVLGSEPSKRLVVMASRIVESERISNHCAVPNSAGSGARD